MGISEFTIQKHYTEDNKKPHQIALMRFLWSGWQDSNLRPPRPKRGAITGLRYTPSPIFRNVTPELDCKYRGSFSLYNSRVKIN